MYKVSSLNSNEVSCHSMRSMLAEHYVSEGAINTRKIKKKNTIQLGEIADVIQIIIFGKKQMQSPPDKGIPLYSGSEILKFEPKPSTYIHKRYAEKFKFGSICQKNWILMTLSGTVGSVSYVDYRFEDTFVTDDAMRIIAKSVPWGYLYAVLKSNFYRSIVENLQYGTVVKHIHSSQISEIPIPIFPQPLTQEIHDLVEEASQLRTEANKILTDCKTAIMNQYGALKPAPSKNAFKIKSSKLFVGDKFSKEFRLEADFYHPSTEAVINHLKTLPYALLGDLTTEIHSSGLRQRNFVENGIPLFAGQHLNLLNPQSNKQLSKTLTRNIGKNMTQDGDILLTSIGTLGKTQLVYQNVYKNVFASQHMLRIRVSPEKIHPGFVYLFLSTDLGYKQIMKYKTGSVIEGIQAIHAASVCIPIPEDKGSSLGEKAYQLTLMRQKALDLEKKAIQLVEKALS